MSCIHQSNPALGAGEKEEVDENAVHCYIVANSTGMARQANFRNVARKRSGYLWLPVLLAVFALAASVATRTSVLSISHDVSMSGDLGGSVRQHMDSDSLDWVPPAATAVFAALVVSFYPRFAPAGPPLPNTLFDESLSNRPPPSC